MTFKTVAIPDNQPSYPFICHGKEYRIWGWLQDGEDSLYSAVLSEVVPTKSGGYGVNNLVTKTAFNSTIEKAGGVELFMNNEFLPKVNGYLASLGGDASTFPENKSIVKQFNWVVENALRFTDNKVVLAWPESNT